MFIYIEFRVTRGQHAVRCGSFKILCGSNSGFHIFNIYVWIAYGASKFLYNHIIEVSHNEKTENP